MDLLFVADPLDTFKTYKDSTFAMMHEAARPSAVGLSPRDREIAAALGPVLAARGLLLVGLDIIGDCLTEINVTSPTCLREISGQSGDVAGLFVDKLEQALA